MKYGRPSDQIQHLVSKVTSQTFTGDRLLVSTNLFRYFSEIIQKSFSYMKYGRPPDQIQHLVTKVTSQTFTGDSLWGSINLLDIFQI